MLLYKSMVIPHLESVVHAWCPNKISNIKLLERLRGDSPDLNKLPYEMRLGNLNMTTVETRRIPGDLREV